MFDTCGAILEKQGVFTKVGTIVDASFVEVPRQRNTREENKMVKEGQTPPAWENQPHKLSQKDLDARWTKKNSETFYGDKNHIRSDAESAIITDTSESIAETSGLPPTIRAAAPLGLRGAEALVENAPAPEVGVPRRGPGLAGRCLRPGEARAGGRAHGRRVNPALHATGGRRGPNSPRAPASIPCATATPLICSTRA